MLRRYGHSAMPQWSPSTDPSLERTGPLIRSHDECVNCTYHQENAIYMPLCNSPHATKSTKPQPHASYLAFYRAPSPKAAAAMFGCAHHGFITDSSRMVDRYSRVHNMQITVCQITVCQITVCHITRTTQWWVRASVSSLVAVRSGTGGSIVLLLSARHLPTSGGAGSIVGHSSARRHPTNG